MQHTFISNSRDYNDWTIDPMIMEDFQPLSHKLFNKDIFIINNNT